MYINDKNLNELEELIVNLGEKKFRAKQIYRQIHKNAINSFEQMTDLSLKLRKKLIDNFKFPKINVLKTYSSKVDSTKKYLLQLEDKNIVEAVFMNYDDRKTICISSQIGCKMGCKFCASTKNGFVRNLTVSELIEQVYLLERINGNINNIVIMGIGEPLDNFDNIIKFLNLLTDKKGRNLSHRSITISTSGLCNRIYDLADTDLDIKLAVSLHYAFDYKRRQYMPIANKFSIDDIIKATDYYFKKTNRRVSFEYVVIDELNNTKDDIKELTRLFKHKNVHINLIPLNPIEEFKYEKTKNNVIDKMQENLNKNGLNATIRHSMGIDIDASCGQLRNNYMR